MDSQFCDGFGERMRHERKRLGLTQEDLATQVNVGQQTIIKYEKENTSPTLKFLSSLQSVDFNMQYLLFGRERYYQPHDFPPEIIRYAANAVSKLEKEFAGGALSDETRLRMMLILLNQYVEKPSLASLTEAQSLELLARC